MRVSPPGMQTGGRARWFLGNMQMDVTGNPSSGSLPWGNIYTIASGSALSFGIVPMPTGFSLNPTIPQVNKVRVSELFCRIFDASLQKNARLTSSDITLATAIPAFTAVATPPSLVPAGNGSGSIVALSSLLQDNVAGSLLTAPLIGIPQNVTLLLRLGH